MCGSQICTVPHLESIKNLRDFPQSQSLETISHDIFVLYFPHDILSVFTREMNVRDETRRTFVTGSGPLCDRTCKFVD